MRLLCLHGQGTSATIFEAQLAPLVSALPPHWTFEFVDAPISCGPGPELGDVYPGPYYCFFESYSPERMSDAVEYVREIVENEGPFHAVIGFSQGASVAAAYLASYSPCTQDVNAFAFAVFICTALIPPALASKSDELEATVGSLLGSTGLLVPSVHVIGNKDLCYGQSVKLFESCDGNKAALQGMASCESTPDEVSEEPTFYRLRGLAQPVYHPGGHDVPRGANMVTKMAKAVERAASMAFLG